MSNMLLGCCESTIIWTEGIVKPHERKWHQPGLLGIEKGVGYLALGNWITSFSVILNQIAWLFTII